MTNFEKITKNTESLAKFIEQAFDYGQDCSELDCKECECKWCHKHTDIQKWLEQECKE